MSVGPPPGNPPTMGAPGSLTSLLDGLVALQKQVPTNPALSGFSETLNLFRWRPDQADPPMLYNWLLPSSNELRDMNRMRDILVISTRVGASYTDIGDRMKYIEAVADTYRVIADSAFWSGVTTPPPVDAFATWAIRSSMQTYLEDVGGTPVLGIEFVQTFWLDRRLS